MGFNLSADVLEFKPLPEPCPNRQSVVISKVSPAHMYLQSNGRIENIPEDDIKTNPEVVAATSGLPSHVILSATGFVAFKFSIDQKQPAAALTAGAIYVFFLRVH